MTRSADALRLDFDRSGSHLTVYVAGEFDMESAEGFADEVIAHAGPGVERLWLDVSALSFCDSSGLKAFERIRRYASELDCRVVLYAPNDQVRRLLEVTRMGERFSVYTSPQAADPPGAEQLSPAPGDGPVALTD